MGSKCHLSKNSALWELKTEFCVRGEGGCLLLLFKPPRLAVQCFSAVRLQLKGKEGVWVCVGRWFGFKNLAPVYQVPRLVRSVAAHRALWLELHCTHLLWKYDAGDSWVLTAGKQQGKMAAVVPKVWQTGHVSFWPWRILRCWRCQTWDDKLWFLGDVCFSC